MMRRILMVAGTVLFAFGLAAPAHASSEKFTFEDVTFPDGTTGIIYANVKTHKSKSDSVTCAYQTSDHQSLGYYLEFVEPAPSDEGGVLQICLESFDERWT